MRHTSRIGLFVAGCALILALPCAAHAATPTATPDATKSSEPTTKTTQSSSTNPVYDLDFTLPTAGKSGCQVCHGDPNLVRVSAETTSSLWVSTEVLENSAHTQQLCTACHVDFAYSTPHDNVVNGTDWRATAKLSCKNCKEHAPQFTEYAAGSHSPAGTPGKSAEQVQAEREAAGSPTEVPTCGDCHGGHEIPSSEDTAAIEALHLTQVDMCGDCHPEYTETYADYYHGAAYQEGAADAPSCTDCHGTHMILPASDRRSTLSEQNIGTTCGKEGCHAGEVDDETFLEYAELVHGRKEAYEQVPLYAVVDSVRQGVQGVVDTINGWFD